MPGEERKQGAVPPPPAPLGFGDGPPGWQGGAPEGWYLDPDEPPLLRYWDGDAWTEWVDEAYGKAQDRGEDPRNNTLLAIGWFTAIFIPLIGLVIGIVLGSRGDRRGNQVVIASIMVILIVTFFVALATTWHGA